MPDANEGPHEGPLSDVLVLDLTRALAGPQASQMMGDLGARVIKVEPPDGDDSRRWGPPFVEAADHKDATYFLSCNRNKESIVLDFKDPDDLEVVRQLARRADVLLENFRPGVMERFGLGAGTLHETNPGLVYLQITGFGHDGPEATRAGYDQIAQGEGGLMSITGTHEPTRVGIPIADVLAGMNGAFGVLAALHERRRTGRGRVVRTSLLAGMVGVHGFQGARWLVAGEVPGLVGNHHTSIAPYGLFRTGTAPVQIACAAEPQWVRLAALLGLPEGDDRFATNADRVGRHGELVAWIEDRLAEQPAEHWLEALGAISIPAGRVRNLQEVYDWEQTRSQGLVLELDHPQYGTFEIPGPVLRFDDQEYAGGRRTHLHPPTLGEHSASIRGWLADTE